VERRGAYKLSGGGRKLLHELDGCRDEGREGKVSARNVVWCQTGGVRWSNYLQISPHAERSCRAVEEAWWL
jgi:hypothetical protein